MDEAEGKIEYSKIITENLDKGMQVRLAINEFRGVNYFQFRKYFNSYEGEWLPSKEGVSIEMTIDNITSILEGITEICSEAEAKEIFTRYLKDE